MVIPIFPLTISYFSFTLTPFQNEYLEGVVETGSSRVTSKGQIVIPKKLRERYAIAPAMRIRWIPKEEGLLMVQNHMTPSKRPGECCKVRAY